MSSSPLTLAFEWRIESPQGIFSGEQKACLVDKMERIATLLFDDRAQIDFSYDAGSVIAKISAKTNADMLTRARRRARDASTRGFQGFVAKILIFWHHLGPEAKIELEHRLAADYLKEEKSQATRELLASFQDVKQKFDALSRVSTNP